MQVVLQPVQLHGSLGREAATGRGTVFAIRELLKHSNAGNIANKTYVIQVCGYCRDDAESLGACVLMADMQVVSCTLCDLLTS